MTIALNPSPITKELCSYDLSKINVLLLNEIEGEALSGEREPEDIIKSLKTKYQNTDIVLTLGEKGVLCNFRNKTVYEPSKKVDVADTTAAGDTFCGYFLAAVSAGKSVQTALQEALAASALAVSRTGAAPSVPTADEVREFLRRHA